MSMLGQNLSILTRLGNTICSYGIYMEKMFWPHPLAVLYPYITHRFVDILIIGVALAAITVAAYHLAKIKPYLLVGWWWYLITLLPVIGIVQVGVQSMADRYTYIPLIGLFIIAAWGSAELTVGLPAAGKAAAVAAAVIVLGLFAWLSAQQVTAWSSSVALFTRSAEALPNNYVAMNSLGLAYWQQGRLDDAQKQFEAVVKMESDSHLHVEGGMVPAHVNLGLLFAVRGRPDKALDQFDIAIGLLPRQPDAWRHKAWLLATNPDERFRNGDAAVQSAKNAVEYSAWKPPEIWDTLAVAEAENWDFEKAAVAEEKAIEVARQIRADDLLPELEKRLKMFKAGEKYREVPRRPSRM
jgi:tetratricopeptide (TPR) repeat protein